MRTEAKRFLASLENSDGLFIEPLVLKKSYGKDWQKKAEDKLISAEIVVIYDSEACEVSENTKWEVDLAEQLGKTIVSLSREDISARNVADLRAAYEFNTEFEDCFVGEPKSPDQVLELYKIMVTSSEQLIQRRQITNGFFITVIGAIVGASGIVVKEGVLSESTILVLAFPLIIGLLMCRSWKNLIDNYGKLNAGKFKVIHQLEHSLDAKIFAAEWVALGKGIREKKYRSFTNTEQIVPTLFSYLLWTALVLTFVLADWEPIFDFARTSWAHVETVGSGISEWVRPVTDYFVTSSDNKGA